MDEKLRSVTYVLGHDTDIEVHYKLREAEDVFASFTNASGTSTNVDKGAPSREPRLVFMGTRQQVLIAQDSVQVTLDFTELVKPLEESIGIALRKVEEFRGLALKFLRDVEPKEQGLVVDVVYPLTTVQDEEKNNAELSALVASLVYKGPELGAWRTADFRTGFSTSWGGFGNLQMAVYQAREGTVRAGHIDISKLKVVEMGITLKLDVNDRPLRGVVEPSFEERTKLIVDGVVDTLKTLPLRDPVKAARI